jgi:hypothetical protein
MERIENCRRGGIGKGRGVLTVHLWARLDTRPGPGRDWLGHWEERDWAVGNPAPRSCLVASYKLGSLGSHTPLSEPYCVKNGGLRL